jgi:hypothetical protein
MANLNLFDIDIDLQKSPDTNDFVELANHECVNQSIDLFITNPYRIGKGLTNRIFASVFSDLNSQTEDDLADSILEEMELRYPFLTVEGINVESDHRNRRIKIKMYWSLREGALSGEYQRYWYQP